MNGVVGALSLQIEIYDVGCVWWSGYSSWGKGLLYNMREQVVRATHCTVAMLTGGLTRVQPILPQCNEDYSASFLGSALDLVALGNLG